jgi:phosphinothricin acetyltransferase
MTESIRLAGSVDAAAIANIYRPIVESTTISFETEAPDEAEMRRRIADTLVSYPWLVCEREGQIAGYAYATKHRVRAAYQWSVDSSVYVQPDFQRRGIGQGLYRSLFAILTAQGFFNAYAGIALPNPASVALHEGVGFKSIGVYRNVGYKLGAWRDVGWWQLAINDPDREPAPPLDLAAVRDRPDWPPLVAAGSAATRVKL